MGDPESNKNMEMDVRLEATDSELPDILSSCWISTVIDSPFYYLRMYTTLKALFTTKYILPVLGQYSLCI
jgi:hypothetical protein